jgi:hypothetical protein
MKNRITNNYKCHSEMLYYCFNKFDLIYSLYYFFYYLEDTKKVRSKKP